MNFKKWLEKQVAGSSNDSLAIKMRKKRMNEFEQFFASNFKEEIESGKKIQILHIGGTYRYWDTVSFKFQNVSHITLLNMTEEEISDNQREKYSSVVGNATDLSQYDDKCFDLCFSNSVIEHVGNRDMQESMAKEMRRVGRHYYLQTPNYWFPFEPHYRLPFVQFFPTKIRARCGFNWKMGYFKNIETIEEARETARQIVLLTRDELKRLFPEDEIRNEKMGLFTKSFYLYR